MQRDNLYLFDFDGTIIEKDSFKDFLSVAKKNRISFVYFYYILCIPYLMLYYLGYYDSLRIKIKRLNLFFGNYTYEDFELFCAYYSNILPSLFKLAALDYLKVIEENNNSDIYIVSGSFDFILYPWCEKNEYKLITNEVKINNVNSRLCFLPINNLDCSGRGKLLRLRNEIDFEAYKYIEGHGNSEGDYYIYAVSDEFYNCFF